MSAVRLHPFHFLKYIKYGLILCVIPILRAMLAFDIAAAWLAFTQDLLILLACGGILATLWQASCAGLADGVLTVRQGVLLRRPALYRACMVSAVEVCRPLWYLSLIHIYRALDLLEEHLDQKPDLEAAARAAGCSSYHFQRMFSYLAGIPLSEYLRRRRMTLAAADLLAGASVLDTALRYGYESPTAFNRAFQSVHGVSPSAAGHGDAALRAFPRISFQMCIRDSRRAGPRARSCRRKGPRTG